MTAWAAPSTGAGHQGQAAAGVAAAPGRGRDGWVARLVTLATPVLTHLATPISLDNPGDTLSFSFDVRVPAATAHFANPRVGIHNSNGNPTTADGQNV